MSLFEKIQNKRYDLQEAPIDDKGMVTPEPGEVKKSEKILNKFIKKQKKEEQKNIKSNTQAGEQLKKDINKRLSASTTKGDQARSQYSIGDGSTIGTPEGTTATKTKTVKQSEVSKDAKEFTKKINKKRTGGFEDVTGEGKVKYPKNRKDLITKRKEYGIDRKGNIGDAGVKRYAQKTKELSSGSNLPVKPTKKELDIAKTRAVGGEKVTNKSGKVIGTTTGKYGGKLARARNKNLPSYADLKAKIDAKNPTYKSPITGGKLPLSTRNYSSPVDKFNKMIEKGKKIDPVGTTKALQNMPNDPRVKVPSRVYVKTQPSKAYPQGFKMIDTKTSKANLEIGKKISKKFVTDKELLTGKKPKIPKVEPVKKPNLFGRLKNLIKSTPKKLKKAHQWMIRDAGYRKTSGSGRLMKDTLGGIARDVNKTRHIYKNTFKGNTLRTLNKVLPGKYKALAVAAVGTSYAVDHHLRKKKKQKEAEKSTILPSGTDTSQVYSTVDAKLKLDTGKKKV